MRILRTGRCRPRPVRSFAEAIRRGDWRLTHQGIALDGNGVLLDGQHRLQAIIEADTPVDMLVFTDVASESFDVLDTGKRRRAADVLAIEGEKMENRPDLTWTSGAAGVTNHQIVTTLERHPKLREYLMVGERIAAATGMIKSAAGAASYLVARARPRKDLTDWFDGLIEGAGLAKSDPRLAFRRVMFGMARRQAGQPMRRRDTREHVGLFLKAFVAWDAGEPLGSLRFSAGEPMPRLR